MDNIIYRKIDNRYVASSLGEILGYGVHPLHFTYYRGYAWVGINGKKQKVHRIIAKAFPDICGEWFEGCEIDHINGDKADNHPKNLRVCTHTENMNNPITKEKMKKAKATAR